MGSRLMQWQRIRPMNSSLTIAFGLQVIYCMTPMIFFFILLPPPPNFCMSFVVYRTHRFL